MSACYADASALLRFVLTQPGRLDLPRVADAVVASALVELECARVFDRLRLSEAVAEAELFRRHASLQQLLQRVWLLDLDRRTLRRAAQPMEAPLGSLDAIHLATAQIWQEDQADSMVFATHDHALARAARLYGFQVLGSGAA